MTAPPTVRQLEAHPEHDATSPVSIHALTVAYHRRPVLWDVDLDVRPGRLVAVVGPNGAGKSTLIRACLGLIPAATGTVRFWGEAYRAVRRRVGYVPQRDEVDWDFPVSALDVAAMGRYGKIGWLRPVSRAHKDAARACLDRVGMLDYADRQIAQLSGGQQQRVFLARALAQEADLYFMDEPLAGVDAATERAIVAILSRMRDEGRTVVCVHHDLQTIERYFDDVIMLNMRVVATGPVSEVFTPETLRQTYGGRLTTLDRAGHALGAGRP